MLLSAEIILQMSLDRMELTQPLATPVQKRVRERERNVVSEREAKCTAVSQFMLKTKAKHSSPKLKLSL